MTLKRFMLTASALSLGLTAMTAQSHDVYIWPDYFTLNSEKPTTVAVDVTATHTTYRSDYAMPSDGVKLFGTDGAEMYFGGPFYQGKTRSTFDLPVEQDGTLRLEYRHGPLYHSSYTIGARDTQKYVPGNKSALLAALPEGAKNAETVAYHSLGMSFVTNNAPTDAVLTPTNQGIEVVPVTHPSDYVTGEDIQISVLQDGKPIVGQDVTIELEGTKYQATPVVMELQSNADGLVNVSFTQGGRYVMKMIHSQPSTDPEADTTVTRMYYAFEVIYE